MRAVLFFVLLPALPAQATDPHPKAAPPGQPVSQPARQPDNRPADHQTADQPTANAIRIDKDGFVLRAGAIDAEEMVTAAARFLQRNILWPAQERQQNRIEPFVLQKDLALDAIGCEEVVSKLLYTRGFAIVPVHADKGVYEVVCLNGPRARDVMTAAVSRTPEEILRQPELKQAVVTQVRLEHISATIAVNALRPFFAQSAAGQSGPGSMPVLGTAGSDASVVITGFQDQVANVIRLLRVCDQPGALGRRSELEERIEHLEKTIQELQQQLAARPKANGDGK